MHARGWMRLRPQQKSATTAIPQQEQQQKVDEVATEANKSNERGGSLGNVQWFEIVQLDVSAEGWIGRSATYPIDIEAQRACSRTTLLGPSGQHAERGPSGHGMCNLCRNCACRNYTCHNLQHNGTATSYGAATTNKTTVPCGPTAPRGTMSNKTATPNRTTPPTGATECNKTATANKSPTSPNKATAADRTAGVDGTTTSTRTTSSDKATASDGTTVSDRTTAATNDGAKVREDSKSEQQQRRRNEQRPFNGPRGRKKFVRTIHESDPNRTVRMWPAEHGTSVANGERYCEQPRSNTRSRKLLISAKSQNNA